ncbi:MAG: DUF502 domain-containing protein [Chlamydiales bacterium]|nr:DUF502 domain-containing protein [Chlamydiia bacterium]MCP5507271.1 DUF502 domain-containing protein [Chlamydiales bacterium]
MNDKFTTKKRKGKLRKYFLTGLAILLPAVLTLMLAIFVINLLTAPFVGMVERTLDYYDLLDKPFLFFTGKQIVQIFSRLLILVLLFLFVVIIGILGRLFIFHFFLGIGNYILHRIPFINKIYKATQDVIRTIFESSSPSFSQVVLVPFPTKKTLALGLVTNDQHTEEVGELGPGKLSVFVPATPNPTVGFMLMFKKEQMIFLDMKVDDALRFIVSCGVICKDLKPIPENET